MTVVCWQDAMNTLHIEKELMDGLDIVALSKSDVLGLMAYIFYHMPGVFDEFLEQVGISLADEDEEEKDEPW